MNYFKRSRHTAGLLLLSLGMALASSKASTINLTNTDPSGSSSFNTAGNWDNGQAPSAGNDYVTTYQLRTPAASGNYTFAGDSLTLSGTGSSFAYKGTGTTDVITVNNLIVTNGGMVRNLTGSVIAFTLAGNITLNSGGSFFDLNNNSPMKVASTIGGIGTLTISNLVGTAQATNAISLLTANSYQGGTTIKSYAYLDVRADGALGTGNVTVTGGKLTLELGTTNNYIADSAKLILSSGLADGAVALNFTGSDSVAGLSLNGGSSYLSAGIYDATTLNGLYGTSLFSGNGTITVVPEPQAASLLLSAALALALAARRRAFQLSA